jgi:CheY-like chemotaxis protein
MSKTLLLADDSVTIQKVVGISFANEDVRIVTVDNGDDAVTRAKEIQPDIVLADVVMPGKSGYEVCASLKEDPALSGVPVLLLTGTFETFDEDRAARVGADGHITKPFEAQALVELVNARLTGAPHAAERSQPTGGHKDERATAPTAELPGTAPTAEPSAAPTAEPEPFDFLEPEQTTARPRAGSGQRAVAEGADDPFGFDSAPLDAPDLDAVRDGLDPLDADATEARTTVLLEDPGLDEAADLAATAPPAEAPPSDEQTRLLPPQPAAEAPAAPESVAGLEPAPTGDPLDDVFDPVLGDALEEPRADGAYDVSSSQLHEPLRTQVIEEAAAEPAAADAPGAHLELDEEAEDASEIDGDDALLSSVAEPIFEDELSQAPAHGLSPEPEHDLPPTAAEPTPPEVPFAAEPDPPEAPFAAEPDPFDAEPTPPEAPFAPEPAPETPAPDAASALSPALQEQVHATLEKMAWEAFGDLSERIVREAVERIEQVAWDVMPRLAETLIREEIRKLKGEE